MTRLDTALCVAALAVLATALGSGPAPAQAAKPLPYHTREAVAPLTSALRSLESAYRMVRTLKDDNVTERARFAAKLDEAASLVKELPNLLAAADAAAEKDKVADHPTLVDARAQVAAAPGRLEAVRAEVEAHLGQAQAAASTATEDVAAMTSVHDWLDAEVLGPASQVLIAGQPIELEAARDLAARIDRFDARRPELASALDAFAARYGSTREEVEKKLDAAGYAAAYDDSSRAGGRLAEARARLERASRLRGELSSALVARAREGVGQAAARHEFYAGPSAYQQCRDLLGVAARVSPESAEVKAAGPALEQSIKAAQAALMARIDKRTWPRQAAVPQAASLASTALKYIRGSVEWGRRDSNPAAKDREPRRPLAVVVTGPWSVQARNLLGQPTMYGLPVLVAVQLDSEKAAGLARVYALTLRTTERAGVKAAPPFESETVGNSYYIRAARVR